MNILIIGNGGREHALAWACGKDERVKQIFVAMGNAGTQQESRTQNVALDTNNHGAVIDFCQKNAITFVLVGNEAPLVAGLVDDLTQAGIAAWGACRYCAQLEGSKDFAKNFMRQHGIPTAKHATFEDIDAAIAYIKQHGAPIVVKADGLAAGKGVVVADSEMQAIEAVRNMLADNKFGAAGSRVVLEDFLPGEEASFICMIDGENILPMATSQDHKRINENDQGENTGGMGAYSPAPVITPEVHTKVMAKIIRPVVQAMKNNGTPYRGFLYAGLMIDAQGNPSVVEFNCRFGDPETQPIMMRLKSSLVELILQGLAGNLPSAALWDDRPALGIVLAADGYPGTVRTGDAITGIDTVDSDMLKVFYAGATFDGNTLRTSGGRVLCVTALGNDLKDAQNRALNACQSIHFAGKYYRKDIGWRAL